MIQKPGTVQAIAIMQLVGGILACLVSATVALSSFFLYIPWIYSLVVGILCIVKGAKLLGANAHLEPLPKTHAILQIINIICCDWINLTLGIVSLVLQNNEEVRAYFEPIDD